MSASPRTARGDPWFNLALKAICALYLVVIIAGVIAYKAVFIELIVGDWFFGIYSIVVCVVHPEPVRVQPLLPAGKPSRRDRSSRPSRS